MEKIPAPVICRQCKKEVKTELFKCINCNKFYHPSCCKQYRVHNRANELVPCDGKIEKYTVTLENGNVTGECSKEYKEIDKENRGSCLEEDVPGVIKKLDSRIDNIYRIVKEVKDEMMGKK